MTTGSSRELHGAGPAGRPLVARLLERLGGRRLLEAFGVPERSLLVWFALLVVFFEAVVLQAVNLASGRPVVFVENPLWLLRPVLLVGAAMATSSLHDRYDRAAAHCNLRSRASDPTRFERLVPGPLESVIVVLGIVFTVSNALFVLTVPQLYAAGGPVRVVRFLVVTPFGYVPIFGAFLGTYLSVEVLTPRRLSRSGVGIDFLDPEKLGGMRPIGELVKYAYYYLMVGLLGFALALYGPHVLDGVFAYEELGTPGPGVNIAFTAVWVGAIATMAYGINELHQFMREEKRTALVDLDSQAREHLDEPWDIGQFDAADPPAAYETYRERVAHVTSTKEYPATFTMWAQILVGVVVPKAIQMVLAAL